jgi:hypothetical protein
MHNRRTIRAALAAFKGNIYQKQMCSQIVLPHHYKNCWWGYLTKNLRACGVGDYKVDYLHEFEAELKKPLAQESEAQGDCLMKKTEGRKSHEAVPLTHQPPDGRIRPQKSYFIPRL